MKTMDVRNLPDVGLERLQSLPIEIKFKKLHQCAKLPSKAAPERDDPLVGDTGYDIFGVEHKVVPVRGSAIIDTGVQIAYITPGMWFRVESKSGLSFKHDLVPHFGVYDNPYRGISTVKIYNFSDTAYTFEPGDKIAQLILYKLYICKMSWSDEVEQTHRGEGRLGSTGYQ